MPIDKAKTSERILKNLERMEELAQKVDEKVLDAMGWTAELAEVARETEGLAKGKLVVDDKGSVVPKEEAE